MAEGHGCLLDSTRGSVQTQMLPCRLGPPLAGHHATAAEHGSPYRATLWAPRAGSRGCGVDFFSL